MSQLKLNLRFNDEVILSEGNMEYGVFLINVIVTEEYVLINKVTKVATRGVVMRRDGNDKKVLMIWTAHRAFPKRSQRKDIWKKLCGGEKKFIHIEYIMYDPNLGDGKNVITNFTKRTDPITEVEIRSLRKKLRGIQKFTFDEFYYYEKPVLDF